MRYDRHRSHVDAELEQFEQVVVGLELKMMELERELSRLRAASGTPSGPP